MNKDVAVQSFVINQSRNLDDLANTLSSHLSKAASAASLGVSELLEGSCSDPRIVNQFLILEDLLNQCQALGELILSRQPIDK